MDLLLLLFHSTHSAHALAPSFALFASVSSLGSAILRVRLRGKFFGQRAEDRCVSKRSLAVRSYTLFNFELPWLKHDDL